MNEQISLILDLFKAFQAFDLFKAFQAPFWVLESQRRGRSSRIAEHGSGGNRWKGNGAVSQRGEQDSPFHAP